jgi:uroporphyrinogen III methyltransferase/synthase
MTKVTDASASPLSGFTILVPFETSAEDRSQLEQAGALVIACPHLTIEAPDDYSALDQAIENLYGYDWLIFVKSHSVSFFLERFQKLGHETSELDALKVCALGESTVELLEQSSVHVDVIPERLGAEAVVAALANYSGGANSLEGLNFLLPQATIGRDHLKDGLANAGTRADIVASYCTVAAGGSDLTRLKTLILSGGVDCLIFRTPGDVNDFASLFDVNELSGLLRNVLVACIDEKTREAASELGAPVVFKSENASFPGIISIISSRLSK